MEGGGLAGVTHRKNGANVDNGRERRQTRQAAAAASPRPHSIIGRERLRQRKEQDGNSNGRTDGRERGRKDVGEKESKTLGGREGRARRARGAKKWWRRKRGEGREGRAGAWVGEWVGGWVGGWEVGGWENFCPILPPSWSRGLRARIPRLRSVHLFVSLRSERCLSPASDETQRTGLISPDDARIEILKDSKKLQKCSRKKITPSKFPP